MRFVAAPEYPVFPTRERPLKPYEAVVLATAETRPAVRECSPDVVVHDILTLAPAMAAELEGVPVATLIPHFHPSSAPGSPPYALGARLPRTAAGRSLWRAMERPVQAGLRQGRSELNETRTRLGLPAVTRLHGGISERLCIVGTFPQLEYPRQWPAARTRRRTADLGAALPRCRAAAGPGSARPGRAVHGAGSRASAVAGGAARACARAGSRAGGDEPQAAGPTDARAGERPGVRLALLRCDDARLRAGDLARRSRHRCPRTRVPAARCWRCRTPATWARTRRGSNGPASASGSRGGC